MAETIYALSSGLGRAGVAVIRVSGPSAKQAVLRLIGRELTPRVAALVTVTHPDSSDVIDRALALWFPSPHSFTGEDVVEFHVHGGRAVVSAIFEALSSIEGLRAAEPGEFTRRAFDNGKLDLDSVEGLADLISADTELQRRQAIRQLTGSARNLPWVWRETLIESQALIEAHLDFPDEDDIPVDVTDEVARGLADLLKSLDAELSARRQAELVRDGAVVLIAGPPNSGKSTLLNRLAAREVAIISEIPGTTRDLIEITLDLRGIPVTFVDSAGIRVTTDPIESQGIKRTRARAEDADLILWLSSADMKAEKPDFDHEKLQVVTSKIDLGSELSGGLGISAASGEGMDELLNFIYETLLPDVNAAESSSLVSQRQFECVSAAAASIAQAVVCVENRSFELAAEELRFASRRLEEMIGSVFADDLLDELFGRFCVGK